MHNARGIGRITCQNNQQFRAEHEVPICSVFGYVRYRPDLMICFLKHSNLARAYHQYELAVATYHLASRSRVWLK